MSLLGKFQKQPAEVEQYAVQYVQALTPTDELQMGYHTLVVNREVTKEILPTGELILTEADVGALVETAAPVTLPFSAPIGSKVFVANRSQAQTVPVRVFPFEPAQENSYPLFAREAAVFRREGMGFVVEATAQSNIVNLPGDQRVRYSFSGGEKGVTYKIETTVQTQEGRVLQDEFQVKIKEV
jgi:hypothetical protein